MKRLWVWVFVLGAAPQDEPDRSPHDLALSADGRWALTANRTSDSVSLVDLAEGKVLAEARVGRRPFAVALRGATAVVTNWLSDTVSVLDVSPPRLAVTATIPVGDEPRGAALAADGATAYVAVSGEDAVAVVDLRERKVAARIAAGDEPWFLALTPDGKRLAAGNSLSGDVSVIDVAERKLLYSVPVEGRNLRQMAVSPDGAWAYVPHITDRGFPTTLANIERGMVIDNRVARVPLTGPGPRTGLALDLKDLGGPDPESVALSPDGEKMAVVAGGFRTLYLLRFPLPFKEAPGEFLEPKLHKDKERYKRVFGLKGRPVAARFLPDGRTIAVANYLGNEIQIVDWDAADVVRSIPLGGPAKPSLARTGEAIFYDGNRSWHAWFSCHTCHTDGHTNGGVYDTFNDGKAGNPKKVLSLRGVSRTGPWTWHGYQKDLGQSVLGSFNKTMAASVATPEDVRAVLEFLRSLDFVPPAGERTEAAVRGEAVFRGKACDACHAPPDYTSDEPYLVGLESPEDAYKGFNPPSLRGVSTRGPYLHDARARTLEEVLQKHHRPSKLSGKPDLTPEELADLLAFLRSL
jgi:YVTN family beta-propeller protein